VKAVRDFLWLLRGELYILRDTWYWQLVHTSFVAFAYLIFLAILVGRRGSVDLSYLVVGSLVFGMALSGMLTLGQNVAHMKEAGVFEYFASLPVSKLTYILALAARGTLLALPSAAAIWILAWFFLDVRLPLVAAPVLLLAGLAMAGFGAVIGFFSPSAVVALLATQILQVVVVFFSPVYYPAALLPDWLRLLSNLWPTTHAASALHAALNGDQVGLIKSALILVAYTLLTLVLVPRKLPWRMVEE